MYIFLLCRDINTMTEQEVRSRTIGRAIIDFDNDNEYERLHRQPSRLDERLTRAQKLDIRAHQRTYHGAYVRTCIGCLSFSLLVMKLFSREFMSIGVVFQIYSIIICLIGYSRSHNIDLYFINFKDNNWYKDFILVDNESHNAISNEGHYDVDNKYYFKTSGNYVLWLTIITLSCYITLFILLAIM